MPIRSSKSHPAAVAIETPGAALGCWFGWLFACLLCYFVCWLVDGVVRLRRCFIGFDGCFCLVVCFSGCLVVSFLGLCFDCLLLLCFKLASDLLRFLMNHELCAPRNERITHGS